MGTVSKNRGMSCVGVRKTGTTLIRVSTVMGTLYDGTLFFILEGKFYEIKKRGGMTGLAFGQSYPDARLVL